MSSQKYMAATTDENLQQENIEKGFRAKNSRKQNETFIDKLKRNRRIVGVVSILLLLAISLFIAFVVFNNGSNDESKKAKSVNGTETDDLVLEPISKSNETKKAYI
jgi:hypothetical protein